MTSGRVKGKGINPIIFIGIGLVVLVIIVLFFVMRSKNNSSENEDSGPTSCTVPNEVQWKCTYQVAVCKDPKRDKLSRTACRQPTASCSDCNTITNLQNLGAL